MTYTFILIMLLMTLQTVQAEQSLTGDRITIPVTATVLNSSDVTGGVVSGTQPVQVDVTKDGTIYSF
jgi:hypothetical protein